ncbi:hypothetical protein [Streptomyces sp. V17-9]|uniref:hypothetical protein n=1 Tax=Streptomyces sp. V17-9 TaxID=2831149 RepID=UPI001BAF3F6A|nr:hypothetical protein [Streptomyces sp. V17-9]QUW92689.1 hypothetical protein KE639_03928 [Streptomyces sp. V17-9]
MAKDYLTSTPTQTTKSAARFYGQQARDLTHIAAAEVIFKKYANLIDALGDTFGHLSSEGGEGMFPEFYKDRRNIRKMIDDTIPVRWEFGLTRSVDSYLTYVSDVLTEALTSHPELLKSQEQVTFENVLRHDSLAEFAQWAAEQRVLRLSYKGLDEIGQYFEKRLGLKLCDDPESWDRLREAVAIRNLVVHRRGIIDERFKRQIGREELNKGDLYTVTREDYLNATKSAMRIVGAFDSRVASKFHLDVLDALEEFWYSPGRWGEGADGQADIPPNPS